MKTCYVYKHYRAVADLVRPGELTEHWTITRINVPMPYRNQGVGTLLLKQILLDADKEGITLQLEVSPSDGLNYDQLSNWYAKYNFKLTETGYLKRRPKTRASC